LAALGISPGPGLSGEARTPPSPSGEAAAALTVDVAAASALAVAGSSALDASTLALAASGALVVGFGRRAPPPFFGGSASEAVAALLDLDGKDLSPGELDELSAMIEQARKEGR
jgi:hypothetical protein